MTEENDNEEIWFSQKKRSFILLFNTHFCGEHCAGCGSASTILTRLLLYGGSNDHCWWSPVLRGHIKWGPGSSGPGKASMRRGCWPEGIKRTWGWQLEGEDQPSWSFLRVLSCRQIEKSQAKLSFTTPASKLELFPIKIQPCPVSSHLERLSQLWAPCQVWISPMVGEVGPAGKHSLENKTKWKVGQEMEGGAHLQPSGCSISYLSFTYFSFFQTPGPQGKIQGIEVHGM